MKRLTYMPFQVIQITADSETTTIAQAINEALELAKQHAAITVEFNLTYNGFEIFIAPDADLNVMINEYVKWLESNSTINTDLPF